MTENPIRVKVLRATNGLRVGQAIWVAGSGVQKLLDEGYFQDITRVQQKRRVFKVSGVAYPTRREAQRVANATGQQVVEVA